MNKPTASVTINITAHREDYYLYRTIRSAIACATRAEDDGIGTVININLDNSDQLTTQLAKDFEKKGYVHVYENSFGDPSASRNFLVSKTKTKYVLVMDGDDLFSDDFIVKSFHTAEEYGKPCVVSAEKIFKFAHNIDPLVHIAESTLDKPEIKSALFETNLYVSENFISTEIFMKCAYEPSKGNYGFEDWHWNTRVVAAGYEFLVAEQTAFFYRQKPDDKSLFRSHTGSNTVIRNTSLFSPDVFMKLPCRKFYPSPTFVSEPASSDQLKVEIKQFIKSKMSSNRVSRKVYGGARRLRKALRSDVNRSTMLASATGSQEISVNIDKFIITDAEKDTWNRLNAIEPLVRFDSTNTSGFTDYRYTFEHSLVTAYFDFCKTYANNNFTDVIFVPWINRGGADLAMVDLARRLSDLNRSVLVITTTGIDSQWSRKMTDLPNVVFIQSHDPIFRHLDHVNMKLFFLRLVQNWSIKTMTVMNSAIGFELVERFGLAIRDTGCKIIVHNYAFPVHEDLLVDAFPSLSMSFENVDKVVVDSQIHKREFMEIYGYPEQQIIEVPLTVSPKINKKQNNTTQRVLFANRIAREKRPDLAIASVKLLDSRGIKMDVYGTVDEEYAKSISFYHEVDEAQNVDFKGTFESTLRLDFSQYDICFMPSLYEGTPRIVLEAAKAGLYIICTDVGGMPEVITSPYSGKVLSVSASAKDFAEAISHYYDSEELQDVEKRHKANRPMLEKHSEAYYNQSISRVYEGKVVLGDTNE